MVKFYTDSHIRKAITVQAQRLGIDVIRCQDVGRENDSDEDHLAYATSEGRTIITADEDYFRLHKEYQIEGKSHAGIIFVKPEHKDDIGLVIGYLEFLHEAVQAEAATLENDIVNQILY